MKNTNQVEEIGKTHDNVLINRHLKDLNPLFFGFEHCLPGKSFGPAVRKYTLIHFVISGEGKVLKKGVWYRVRAGEAFLIFPDEVVTYCADRENPWYYQWIGFDGELSSRFSELGTVISVSSNLVQEALNIEANNMREYRIAALLFSFYATLFEKETGHHHYVRRVQDHIRALYMQPLRVEEIADKMNLDRRYLSRIFKKKTGQTVQDYLISVRMEEAKRCLLQGFSVEESAKLCGYEDSFNFSKMFKRRFGISPQSWKKKAGMLPTDKNE